MSQNKIKHPVDQKFQGNVTNKALKMPRVACELDFAPCCGRSENISFLLPMIL